MEPTMSNELMNAVETGKLQRNGAIGGAQHSAAERIHKAADSLREKGTARGSMTNRMASNAASAMDQAATYIDNFSTERLRNDTSGLVRRRPLQSIAVGVLFGFVAARFLRR